jgi:hypothetical protein
MLVSLGKGTLTETRETILSRPGQPFWVHGQSDRLVALFPVLLKRTADDPLISAFAQVFRLEYTLPVHILHLM